MSTDFAHRFATVFVEITDTLVDNVDVIEFLQLLTRRVGGLFDTGEVGLLRADHRGRLIYMAASTRASYFWRCSSCDATTAHVWRRSAPGGRSPP